MAATRHPPVLLPRTNGEESPRKCWPRSFRSTTSNSEPPREILLDREIPDADLLVAALSASAERKVQLSGTRGERAGYVELASRNAQLTLATELNSRNAQQRAATHCAMLGLAEPVKRVECFDISHTLGEATVASCVVFDAAGPVRAQYRRFNISGIEPGDDYAAMRQPSTAASAVRWKSRACCRTCC